MKIDYELLIKTAIEFQKNSYSPYYKYKVGAALLTENNKIFGGTNIENSAGCGICAERSAFVSAISNGAKKFHAIAVVGGDLSEYITPCGVCRQYMVEFNPNLEVVSGRVKNGKIEFKIKKLKELLPDYFGAKDIEGHTE